MRKQGAGHIANVASVSAHRVDPAAAVYGATKYAVRALSDGLRQESRNLRVKVVSPGLTRSGLFDGIGNPQVSAGVHALLDLTSIPAAAIAEAISDAISQPANVDVNELIVRPTAQWRPASGSWPRVDGAGSTTPAPSRSLEPIGALSLGNLRPQPNQAGVSVATGMPTRVQRKTDRLEWQLEAV